MFAELDWMTPKITPFEENVNPYERWFEDHPFAYQSELLPEVGIGSGRFALPCRIEPSCKMSE